MAATCEAPVSHLDPAGMRTRKAFLLDVAGLPESVCVANTNTIPAPLMWRARVCSMDEIELYRWNPWCSAERPLQVDFVSYWNELKAVRMLETQLLKLRDSDADTATPLLADLRQHCLRLTEETASACRGDPCQLIDKTDASRPYAELDGMLTAHGMKATGVAPAMFPESTGRGLVFTRDVTHPEPVVAVPRNLLFNIESVQASELSSLYDSLGLDRDTQLLLYLIHEKFGGRAKATCDGKWQPFVALLPESYDTLFFWDSSELAALQGSRLLAECMEQKSHLRGVYDALFPRLTVAHPDAFPAEVYTFQSMLWARAVFDSRAFIINIEGREMTTLVPYAEFINHSGKSGHVSFRRFDTASQCMLLESLGRGEKGGQAFMNYGPMQNSDLLLGYGFACEGNPLETCVLDLDMEDEDDELCGEKAAAIATLQIPKEHLLDRANTHYHYLIAALRVAVCETAEDIAALVKGSATFKGPLNPENEERAKSTMEFVVQSLMSEYPTTLEDDVQLLQHYREGRGSLGPHSEVLATPRIEMALVYRVEQKRVMQHALNWARAGRAVEE